MAAAIAKPIMMPVSYRLTASFGAYSISLSIYRLNSFILQHFQYPFMV
ncbi:hypothetical protein ACFPFV_04685 [Salinicoccus siamensis]